MKKSILAVALSFGMIAATQAAGIAGGLIIGGGVQVVAGNVNGSASSSTTGQAITSAQNMGSGWSNQHADGLTQGSATIGGAVTPGGAVVVTGTTQISDSNVRGSVGGNAPIADSTGALINAGAAFGKVENKAIGAATFGTSAILAVAGIGGAVGIVGF